MQKTSSNESTTVASPVEPPSTLKVRCPVTSEGLTVPAEPSWAQQIMALKDDELTAESPGNISAIHQELLQLRQSGEERVAVIQQKLAQLKAWINESFHVADIHAWMEANPVPPRVDPETQSKRSDSISESRTDDGTTKPVLRIKLVDDKIKSPPAGATSPSEAPRGGTGSKNLSRMMSRPVEASVDAKFKVGTQTPVNIFWNYVEPFFKTIDETDLRVLEDTTRFVDPAPFTIPPLGKHYTEHWKEQYGYMSHAGRHLRRKLNHGMVGGDGSGGEAPRTASLRERLLAMMIEENLTVPETSASADSSSSTESVSPGELEGGGEASSSSCVLTDVTMAMNVKNVDYVHVDERIRHELAQSGLCMFVPKLDYQEDDMICADIRALQKQLREQVCLNRYRKRKLAKIVREKLPAQEFYTLLNEIDKQIEQTFSKRVKNALKNKKKKGLQLTASPSSSAVPTECLALVETRRRLVTAFAGLVPSQTEFLAAAPPQGRLFEPSMEEKVLEYARNSGNWLPIPDQPPPNARQTPAAAQAVFPSYKGTPSDPSIVFETPTVLL